MLCCVCLWSCWATKHVYVILHHYSRAGHSRCCGWRIVGHVCSCGCADNQACALCVSEMLGCFCLHPWHHLAHASECPLPQGPLHEAMRPRSFDAVQSSTNQHTRQHCYQPPSTVWVGQCGGRGLLTLQALLLIQQVGCMLLIVDKSQGVCTRLYVRAARTQVQGTTAVSDQQQHEHNTNPFLLQC